MNPKPMFQITSSFSKKIQIKQYEPEEFFYSTQHVFYDVMPTEEEKIKVGKELFQYCEKMVLAAARYRVKSLSKETSGEDGPF